MKGKVKHIYRSIIILVALVAAAVCIAFNGTGSNIIYAVWIADNDFSLRTNEGSLIMSVEKVGINASGDATTKLLVEQNGDPIKKMIYGGTSDSPQAYYYTDLYGDLSSANTDSKYVVNNGEYVMLNNDNIGNELYNQNIPVAFNDAGEQVHMAEAIMVSFGQYYLNNGSINLAGQPDFNSGAEIEQLLVTARHNGQTLKLNNPRAYNNNLYNDFAYIIPQQPGNEGRYDFTFNYFYKNYPGPIEFSFSFNILFKTSYTQTQMVENDAFSRFYTAQPTIFNPQDPNAQNGSYTYNLGKDANYPVLIYDYTKYSMSFTHTLAGSSTTYTYLPSNIRVDGNSYSVALNANISGVGEVSYPMQKFSYNGQNYVVFVLTEMGDYTFNFNYLYENQTSANSIELSSSGMNLTLDPLALSINGFELKYAKNNYREAQLRYINLANAATNAEVIAPSDIEKLNSLNPALNLQKLTAKFNYDASQANQTKLAGSTVETVDANISTHGIDGLTGDENLIELANSFVGTKNEDNDQDLKNLIGQINFIKINQPPIYLEGNVDRGANSFRLYVRNLFTVASSVSEKNYANYYVFDAEQNKYVKATSYEVNRSYFDINLATLKSSKQDYDNLTRFNEVGYYLVFINVGTTSGYYQVFAFNYSSETVNANIIEQDSSRQLGNDEYTNKAVTVSWKEPTMFESEIAGYYYYILDRYLTGTYTSSQLIAEARRMPIINGQTVIGSTNDIPIGHGASIVVELAGEGQTFRSFTIDRTAISGIGLYAVGSNLISNGVAYYRVLTANDGSPVRVDNAIYNGMVTLFWNEKLSGAEISASYIYLPFEKDDSGYDDAKSYFQVFANDNECWFRTTYKLGNPTGRLTDIYKPNSLDDYLTGDNVLSRQGIYLFTFTDVAGNSCNYMFVLDNTEAYFKIVSNNGEEFASRTSKIYDDDTRVELSTHKAIDINDASGEMLDAITSLASGNVPTNYYAGETLNGIYNPTNINALYTLFKKVNDKYYITVRNERIYPYDSNQNYDGSIIYNSLNNLQVNNNILRGSYVKIDHAENEISVYRELYIVGANQRNISALSSNSFITIEVNTDNSRLMAYYSNVQFATNSDPSNIPTDGLDSGYIIRLRTGTTFGNNDSHNNPFVNAQATSENFVGIVWNKMDNVTGNFEVESVTYSFYALGSVFTNDNYYYTPTAENVSLYSNNSYSNGAFAFGDGGNKAFAFLRVINGATQEGLYKITRTYKNDVASGNDHKTVNYFLIVDRTDVKTSGVGDNISVGLKEDETLFNSFTRVNTESDTVSGVIDRDASGALIYNDNGMQSYVGGADGINYNIYFTTNKLPAVLNIPYAKYFNGTHSSSYHAGALNFKVIYRDRAGQLNGISGINNNAYLIFTGTALGNENGYYTIDFRRYINYINTDFASRFVSADNGTNWICLPGDYVVIVSDNVRSLNHLNGGTHQLVFGFRISPNAPSTDVYTVPSNYSEERSNYLPVYDFTVANGKRAKRNADGSYTLTTNEEFVAIELPAYTTDSVMAGVDINYIVVTKNDREYYINYQYTEGSASHTLNDPDFVKNTYDAGAITARTIYLQTDLRDERGNINPAAINENLTYKITIRFRLLNNNNNEYYKNAYYYYVNGVKNTYFEVNYVIKIDRLAPSANVVELVGNDDLIKYYNGPMFKNDFYSTTNNVNIGGKTYSYCQLYFVNEYGAYVKDERTTRGTLDASEVYALKVDASTILNHAETSQIYYREYTGTNLSMPTATFDDYTPYYNNAANLTYGNLFENEMDGYYEVLELDEAGNITQYVVLYANSPADNLVLGFKINEGETVNFDLSKPTASQLTIFGIEPQSNNSPLDKFYHFELVNRASGEKYELNTNFTTQFGTAGLVGDLANMITNAHPGNYSLVMQSRSNTISYNLDYYDRASLDDASTQIAAKSLVSEDKQSISFAAQLTQKPIEQNSLIVYAKTITITHNGTAHTYTCQPNNGYRYVDENGQVSTGMTGLSGTYKIMVVDTLNRKSFYEFNTEKELYFITFGEDGNSNVYPTVPDNTNRFYTFNQANIQFDTSIYRASLTYRIGDMSNKIDCNDTELVKMGNYTIIEVTPIEDNYIKITLYPYLSNASGEILTATVELTKNADTDQEPFTDYYYVTVDSYTSGVTIKNSMGNSTALDVAAINADVFGTQSSANTSGTTYLGWNRTENTYFDYSYSLVCPDGSIKNLNGSVNSNGLGNREINPSIDGVGVYRFVVEIFAKGIADLNAITPNERATHYLGNKVYTFTVNEQSSRLYTVHGGNDILESNAQFNFEEDVLNDGVLNITRAELLTVLGLENNFDFAKGSWKLFIYNTPMTVVPEVELHAQITSYPRNAPKKIGDYELVIYKITSPTTPQPEFIATLYVPKTTEVLDSDNFELNSTRLDVSESTYFNPFVGTQQTNMSLKAKQNLLTECDFVKKNVVSAQVIYNGFNLQTALGSNAAFEYSILGSGDYEFVFADLAGNVHQFSETENRLHLTILREVAITVNGHSPINGAIYSFDRYAENSTPVTISVVGGGNYYLRNSINIKVQKNWQDYSGFGQQNYNYTFTEYGNYRVSFTATDLFEQLGAPLTKTIEFSIINPNEASELLDLTRLGNFTFTKISKLVNGTRQDITAGFKQVVNMQNGMMLDYKTLLAHREEFRTSSGKQTFEITYLVDNDIYEPREVTFAATLNNEQPIIYCSLEYGQSSTSGFSISYTPSIIYDQVGDSAIYINNVLVATIDKTSASQTEVVEQYFSQAEYGTGDYLIVLYSSSGVPLTYYKVTLNEPLNVWAIIIIVVVVAVVTTVIVLIFVLRHKMRIR